MNTLLYFLRKSIPIGFLIYLAIGTAFAQTVTISGTVTDKNGQGLPGVNIVVKGTTVGTITDTDGKYTVSIPNDKKIIIFSFVGYIQQEVEIGNQTTINITLEEDLEQLEEVVVVGYGTVKKSDLTGAVATVSAKDLNMTVNQSFQEALQGRTAGVQILSGEGTPGGDLSIRVRGGTSISASNEPLYVIDGFPIMVEKQLEGFSAEQQSESSSNILGGIDPADIKSIEILKDASATAIYGSRGANGVILITTKRGQAGKAQINFQTFVSFQEVTDRIDVLNGVEYAQYRLDLDGDPSSEQSQFFTDVIENPNNYEFSDWQDEIYRTSAINSYRLSMRGGSNIIKYNVSLGAFLNDGIIKGSSFDRYNGRLNLDAKLSERINLSSSVSFAYTQQLGVPTGGSNLTRTGVVSQAIFFPPLRTGNDDVLSDLSSDNNLFNPLTVIEGSSFQTDTDLAQANFSFDYKVTDDITFKVLIGANQINSRRAFFFTSNTPRGALSNGEGGLAERSERSWVNENTLTYNKTFGRHTLNVLVGVTAQSATIEASSFVNTNFAIQDLGFDNIGAGSIPLIPQSSKEKWALASGLARINYGFNDRYLFTFSIRADGSSRFSEGNKWGYFPAAAFAWKVKNENFLKNFTPISEFKLRFGYGITGNQEVPRYRSFSSLSTVFYNFGLGDGLTAGVGPERIGNSDLTWETTTQYNLGLDFGLFTNRITGAVDIYYKKTKDMLLAVDLIPEAGLPFGSLRNIGSLENRGIEFILNTVNIEKGDFSWTSSFNISINQNEILDLGEFDRVFRNAPGGNHQVVNEVILTPGSSIGMFYGYETRGVLGEDENGNPQVLEEGLVNELGAGGRIYVDQITVDTDGDGVPDARDGVINEDDRVELGSALPKHYGGFTNTFSYKGFDLNVFFDWSYGNKVYNSNRVYLEELHADRNVGAAMRNAWTPENQNTDIAQIGQGDASRMIDRFVEDGSFIRLRSITLGYNFDKNLLSKISLESLRIYVSGQNLWTGTDYQGYNPQASISPDPTIPGVDWGAYPVPKIYTVGLNVTF